MVSEEEIELEVSQIYEEFEAEHLYSQLQGTGETLQTAGFVVKITPRSRRLSRRPLSTTCTEDPHHTQQIKAMSYP